MKDLNKLLREGDPLAREPELDPGEVARITRQLREYRDPERDAIWAGSIVLTAAGMFVMAAVALTSSVPERSSALPDRVRFAGDAAQVPETRQLHFATPGGTRIIWVFDPDFEVR